MTLVGMWSHYDQTFLLILATGTTLFFALPLFIAPLHWAKLMLWEIPEKTDLTVYFGRCVGAFVLLVELIMFRAAFYRHSISFVYESIAALWILMLIVHVWGWIRKIQPITETLENIFWLLLLFLTVACWPVTTP